MRGYFIKKEESSQNFSRIIYLRLYNIFIMEVEKISEPHTERNFTIISPSAKTLLLMKGHTRIPFASQVAELAMRPQPFEPDFQNKDFIFWVRLKAV